MILTHFKTGFFIFVVLCLCRLTTGEDEDDEGFANVLDTMEDFGNIMRHFVNGEDSNINLTKPQQRTLVAFILMPCLAAGLVGLCCCVCGPRFLCCRSEPDFIHYGQLDNTSHADVVPHHPNEDPVFMIRGPGTYAFADGLIGTDFGHSGIIIRSADDPDTI